MGLKDKLLTDGSPYSVANGGAVAINPLALKTSQLHSNGVTGYSLDGAAFGPASTAFAQYNDGIVNPIPLPTTLDMEDPTSSTLYKSSNTYSDNPPQ